MENKKNGTPDLTRPAQPPEGACCPLYRVQAGCYQDAARAEQTACRLRGEGYRAFVIPKKPDRT